MLIITTRVITEVGLVYRYGNIRYISDLIAKMTEHEFPDLHRFLIMLSFLTRNWAGKEDLAILDIINYQSFNCKIQVGDLTLDSVTVL